MKKLVTNNLGFTLVELMLVITLGAISIGVTSNIILSLIRSYSKTGAINEVEQQANFVASRLDKEIKSASSVNLPGGDSNQLALTINGVVVYYNIANQNIYRSASAASTADADAMLATPALNQSTHGIIIECAGACFTISGTNPQVVDLSMVFKQANTPSVVFAGQINVKSTIILRNSY